MESITESRRKRPTQLRAAKADGKVTKKERVHLNREANRNSRKIHRQKHDAQTAAPANPR